MLPIIGFLILMTSLNLNDVISQRFLNPDNIIQKFPNNDDIIQRFPNSDDIYQRLPNPDDLIQMPIKYWWHHSKAFTDELNTDLTNVWAAFADLDGALSRSLSCGRRLEVSAVIAGSSPATQNNWKKIIMIAIKDRADH